jgi:hypothetical protein
MYAHGSSMHQKYSNHALTNLLFELCRSVWIIDPFIIHPSPHPRALTRPSTPEMLWAKECTPTPSFIVFTFELTFESFKECGGASCTSWSYFLSCMPMPFASVQKHNRRFSNWIMSWIVITEILFLHYMPSLLHIPKMMMNAVTNL